MKKGYDTIKTKPAGGQRVYNAGKGMSIEQEVAFLKRQTASTRREVSEKHRTRTINK